MVIDSLNGLYAGPRLFLMILPFLGILSVILGMAFLPTFSKKKALFLSISILVFTISCFVVSGVVAVNQENAKNVFVDELQEKIDDRYGIELNTDNIKSLISNSDKNRVTDVPDANNVLTFGSITIVPEGEGNVTSDNDVVTQKIELQKVGNKFILIGSDNKELTVVK